MILVRNLRLPAEEEFCIAAERLPEFAAKKLTISSSEADSISLKQ